MPAVAEPRRGRTTPAGRPAPAKRGPAAKPPAARRRTQPAKGKGAGTRTAATHVARRRATRPATPARALPGWGDLDGAAPRAQHRRRAAIDAIPTLRLAAWVLIASVGLTLYVGHVYATRSTLESLQAARRDNLRLHLTAERLRATFDAMTGPSQILPRAAALGLHEGVAYGPPIHLSDGE